ncbi:hypothetical protein TRFO_32210 [Tritrichomonas foetus]|uniref:Uncharacterized protein n=1 Tax=Tritrichomonas foetus TaxID=1144522 RepID=A0A1J4JTW6_9EUKA|nr:hypothetical protein TRFO_32210 [Tritrichomonas foetus]|eukprot:OHT00950.1 hypothetical protein TRFO_32210 [Tritrichomonas foetus]
MLIHQCLLQYCRIFSSSLSVKILVIEFIIERSVITSHVIIMNDQSNKDENFLLNSLISSKNEIIQHDHPPEVVVSLEEIQNKFQLLLNMEHREQACHDLMDYLAKNECPCDQTIIVILFNLFLPTNPFGAEGVVTAVNILHTILKLRFQDGYNREISDVFMNFQFYEIIWQYYLNIPIIMKIFDDILMIQEEFKDKYKNGVYSFLVQHDVFNILSTMVQVDNPRLIPAINTILSFLYYSKSIQFIISIIPSFIEIVFSYPDVDIYGECFNLLSYFSREYSEIGFVVFSHPLFARHLSNFEIDRKYSIIFLNYLSEAFKNQERLEENGITYGSGTKFHGMIEPFAPLISHYFLRMIQISASNENKTNSVENNVDNNNDLLQVCLITLADFIFKKEHTTFFVQNGLPQFLFNLMNSDMSFNEKIYVMKVILVLVTSADEQCTEFFISLGFFELLNDIVEELLTSIPHDVLDALENINYYGEESKDRSVWSQLIFDNENIFEVIQKASEGFYVEKEYQLYHELTLREHATALLARMYNVNRYEMNNE